MDHQTGSHRLRMGAGHPFELCAARTLRSAVALFCLIWGLCCWPQSPAANSPGKGDLQEVEPGLPQMKGPYMLQEGDDIEIKAFNNPELAQSVKVRPDGRISLLLLDDVVAAGLTPAQLGQNLSRAYSEYFRTPKISVIVRSFSNVSVYVGGEVAYPKFLPLTGRVTVTQAVFSAGGVKNSAKLNDVLLLRDSGEGKAVVTKLNLEDILKHGGTDTLLKPFDVVYVPKTRIARIDQFLDEHIRQVIPIPIGLGFSYLLGQQPLIQ
jgi:protein involved in polysaccharide export with SLBB domain